MNVFNKIYRWCRLRFRLNLSSPPISVDIAPPPISEQIKEVAWFTKKNSILDIDLPEPVISSSNFSFWQEDSSHIPQEVDDDFVFNPNSRSTKQRLKFKDSSFEIDKDIERLRGTKGFLEAPISSPKTTFVLSKELKSKDDE